MPVNINANKHIPKKIWMLWLQGRRQAPFVVEHCIASWERHNPNWDIIVLDEKNISDYLEIESLIGLKNRFISKQALSDIIRINLLNRYGGVWIDATCYCCKSLESWLYTYTTDEFFAFDNPGIDRPISSWFLASSKNSVITKAYSEIVNSYWSNYTFVEQNSRKHKLLDKLLLSRMEQLSYNSPKFRVIFCITVILRVYPYFWFHYLFAKLLRTNPRFLELWDSQPKISADIPHVLQHHGLFNQASPDIIRRINAKSDPLYKLTWKFDKSRYVNGCVLKYLLSRYD